MDTIDSLPKDFVNTFIRHVNMIKFIGINIFVDKNAHLLSQHGRLMIFSCFVIPMLIGQIVYLFRNDRTGASFLEVINAIPSTFMVLQDIVKMFVAASKRDQIRQVIFEIGEVWPRDIQGDNKVALKEWTRRLRLYDNAYLACAIVALWLFELMPLVVTIYSITSSHSYQYEFPVQVYFFCWLTNHYQYALAYSYFAIMCSSIHMCIYISCDFVLVALTFDVSALLSLLQNDLRNIVQETDIINRNENCKDIKRIVVTHQKLLRLTKRLDDIFGAVIFTQVSFSSVVICCFGFLAVIDNGLSVARHITAALGIMYAMFIIAYPGQLLADTSYGVASAAYECLWYNRGVKFQKYIAIILARAQKPCYLTAMGFAELTLAMFSRVLSTSWSYLSLLNQMYQDMEL